MYKIINKKKRYATIAADIVGTLAYAPARLCARREEIRPAEVRELLVIRTAYIGDVVMTLPMLKPLRQRFPQARISFLTGTRAAAVLENNPYLDAVIGYDPFWFYRTGASGYRSCIRELRRTRFDVVIEARADIRELLFLVRPLKARHKVSYAVGGGGYLLTDVVPYGGLKHKVEYHLDIARHLGCPDGPVAWGIYLREEEERMVEETLRRAGIGGPFIAVHPGSRLPLKLWSPERYAALCDALGDSQGLPVVLFGSADERQLAARIAGIANRKTVNLAGGLTLREMAGLFSRATILVCNDSSPMHIAAAMKTPTVAVFGPSKSVETGPYAVPSRVVEKDYPCRYDCDESTCRNSARPHGCMRDIAVEDVLCAAQDLLAQVGGAHVPV
jgi:predicted lipopolysaccharide heptosyltransferase III